MPQAAAVAERSPGPPGRQPAGSDFAPLLRTAKEQGLLDRRIGWYARTIAINAIALTAIGVAMYFLGDSWWVLLLAPMLSVLCARTAFIGHDAGHSQITGKRSVSRAIGLIHGNLLLGMSSSWWNDKHNRHHANPNHIEKDPDVAANILVWTSKQAKVREGFRRWLTRNQAWLFFPLTLLQGVAMKIYGFQDLRRQPPRERLVEGLLLVVHLVGYVALLITAMPVGHALAFAAVHQALFGLHLGLAFAPNHKGMEMPDPDGERLGHLHRQVLTSRNIRGNPVIDWFLGGLNHQIEHHLFPSMPRPHLRLAKPAVRAHCAAVGIPYAEARFVDSYRQVLRHMYEVGEPLRAE
ncbi:fatty acid desaturase family protein [Streptomyces sp. DSM 118878]